MPDDHCINCRRWDVAEGKHCLCWQRREQGRCCHEDSMHGGHVTPWWWGCECFVPKEDEDGE